MYVNELTKDDFKKMWQSIVYKFLADNDLTQAELAEAIDVEQSTIAQWVNHEIEPTGYNLVKFVLFVYKQYFDWFQIMAID